MAYRVRQISAVTFYSLIMHEAYCDQRSIHVGLVCHLETKSSSLP